MEQLNGRLHYLESRMVHLHNEERESIQVIASSSLKFNEDTRKVLNYSEDNFEILQTNRGGTSKKWKKYNKPKPVIIEDLMFLCMLFAPKVQLTTYHGSWTLNAMHSELQVQTLYLTEQINIFITTIGVLSKGILPAALVPYEILRKIITTVNLGDKKFYTIRPLKFTLQPALSEKGYFQSTRTFDHNGGACIQW